MLIRHYTVISPPKVGACTVTPVDRIAEELCSTLVDSLDEAPLLLLTTYRPGYQAPWIVRSTVMQVPLAPLTPQESLALVTAQAGEIPIALSQAIVQRAEGNPFFLEELTRHLKTPPDPVDQSTVPTTVHDAILARLAQLPDTARAVLQTAAVLGRDWSARLLAAMWHDPADRRLL